METDATRWCRHRLAWLLAAVLLGTASGLVVRWAWGSDVGFLAVPALLALGWLFWADPTQCESRGDREAR